jgi:hypothetical protein
MCTPFVAVGWRDKAADTRPQGGPLAIDCNQQMVRRQWLIARFVMRLAKPTPSVV